jgi:Na+/proline symporter
VLPLIAQQHLPTVLYILFAGALISAILSTVDSALLAASSLVSHNLILPLRPGMSEAAKVRTARVGVVVFAVIAYVLAIHGGSVYELVSDASAFAGAGLFIIIVFGLFTSFGGARSAYAALIVGMTVWVYGNYIGDFSYSFLASLGAAFSAYMLVAVIEPQYSRQLDSAEETS